MSGYRTVVADPPWRFGDSLPGNTRGAVNNYRTMSAREIESFVLPQLADDCLLFLWRVTSMAEEALGVVRAWGFCPKAELVWVKTAKGGGLAFGMGRYVRAAHESCIIARRGRAKVQDRSVRSVFYAPRRAHSEKPEEFFGIVEKLSPGPYLELFSRRSRPGWECLGLEAGLLGR